MVACAVNSIFFVADFALIVVFRKRIFFEYILKLNRLMGGFKCFCFKNRMLCFRILIFFKQWQISKRILKRNPHYIKPIFVLKCSYSTIKIECNINLHEMNIYT